MSEQMVFEDRWAARLKTGLGWLVFGGILSLVSPFVTGGATSLAGESQLAWSAIATGWAILQNGALLWGAWLATVLEPGQSRESIWSARIVARWVLVLASAVAIVAPTMWGIPNLATVTDVVSGVSVVIWWGGLAALLAYLAELAHRTEDWPLLRQTHTVKRGALVVFMLSFVIVPISQLSVHRSLNAAPANPWPFIASGFALLSYVFKIWALVLFWRYRQLITGARAA